VHGLGPGCWSSSGIAAKTGSTVRKVPIQDLQRHYWTRMCTLESESGWWSWDYIRLADDGEGAPSRSPAAHPFPGETNGARRPGAVITGSTRGIGRAVADLFAARAPRLW